MKSYEDTLQVCTLHRILQTLDAPCEKCLEEIRHDMEERKKLSQQLQAMVA